MFLRVLKSRDKVDETRNNTKCWLGSFMDTDYLEGMDLDDRGKVDPVL